MNNRTLTQADIKLLEAELEHHLFDKFYPEVMDGRIPDDLDQRVKEEIRWWCQNPDATLDRLPVNINWGFQCVLQMDLPPSTETTRFEVKFVHEPAVPAQSDGWHDDPLEL